MARPDFLPDPARSPAPWLGALALGLGLLGLWAFVGAPGPYLAGGLAVLALATGYAAWRATLRPSRPPDLPEAEGAAEARDGLRPETFAFLLDQSPDPVLVLSGRSPDDPSTLRIEHANAAAVQLFRIPATPVLLVSVLRDPEVLSMVDEALFGRVAARGPFSTGGSQDRNFQAEARPVGGEAGEGPMAVLWLRDETDLRRAERTRADFLANASHELRTPLASMSGFIETLKGHARNDREAQDRFLDIMQKQAGRMGRLIEDLLSLSRIELNEHVAPRGRTDLALAAADVVDALAPQAEARGVTVRSDLPPGGGAVICGDRDQLVQVIQNLLDNALKYAPPGGAVHLSVQGCVDRMTAEAPVLPDAARLALVSPDSPAERFALVRVRDEGPGLEREHLPRLAERFYRVEGQKSGDRPGTGLGLSIAKHIVNRHNGVLAVESAPGQGTVFTVLLPTAAAAKPEETQP